jgi:hypothetical protein
LTALVITNDVDHMSNTREPRKIEHPDQTAEQSGDSGLLDVAAGTHAGHLPGVSTEWPRTTDGRLICSPVRPMPADARVTFGGSALWQHGDVEDIGECADGCCDRKRCKSCGVRWLASYGR